MRHTGLLLISLLLFSCTSNDLSPIDPAVPGRPNPLEGLSDKGPIRFDNPAIGQRSYYVFFDAEFDSQTEKASIQYSSDTLVLAITGKESVHWVLKDFLTDGSISRKDKTGGYWGGWVDSVFVRHLRLDADSIHIVRPPNAEFSSFVFQIFERKKITFPVSLISYPAVLNANCLPFDHPLGGEFMEYTLDYTQLGQTFDHLNNYFDNRGMEGDGLGYMYAYSHSVGVVGIAWVSAWDFNEAKGWDLISNK